MLTSVHIHYSDTSGSIPLQADGWFFFAKDLQVELDKFSDSKNLKKK